LAGLLEDPSTLRPLAKFKPFMGLQGVRSVQTNISARHGHLSPGTQEKITEKVEKLRRLNDRMTSIQVTVDLEHRDSPTVEVRVTAEHSEECVATGEGENVIAALDVAVHRVEAQLRKHREKQIGHRLPGHKHLEGLEDPEG